MKLVIFLTVGCLMYVSALPSEVGFPDGVIPYPGDQTFGPVPWPSVAEPTSRMKRQSNPCCCVCNCDNGTEHHVHTNRRKRQNEITTDCCCKCTCSNGVEFDYVKTVPVAM